MENNRYREEEKELEKQEETKVDESEKVTEIQSEKSEIDELVEDSEELEEELKKDAKYIKKLKKKNHHLEDENKKMTDEILYLKDQLLRNQAELENFKRRTNEERIRERKYAMQDFFTELITVIDTFDKVVSAKTDDEKLKKYLVGFVMINNNMKQILENYGVKKIECLNQEFDPTFHQAIEVVEVENTSPNIVVEVIADGYLYKDRVLRPAMVKVSK
jgi:grpE